MYIKGLKRHKYTYTGDKERQKQTKTRRLISQCQVKVNVVKFQVLIAVIIFPDCPPSSASYAYPNFLMSSDLVDF
jgi:hypothetical protein